MQYDPAKLRDVSIPLNALPKSFLILSTLLIFVPIVIHILIWGYDGRYRGDLYLLGAISIVVLILLHELTHAAGWIRFAHVPPNQIKFGFAWKTLSPYAHSKIAMSAWGYRRGVILPLIVTGIIPSLIGILTGAAWLTVAGGFMIGGAAGDLIVLWAIRDVPDTAQVIDHPKNAGCYVVEA